jgi:diaminohydroxyphosphoribosylaminopyrimidine deaminase/5-amino-6-(5-phosphoribosylamino)uracil reductase
MTATHERFMQQALALARLGEGRTRPNPPVGALVVRDGAVLGEGFHPRAGEPHAEIFALRQAGTAARGADLYVTLEPCCHQGRTGPCTEAILDAGIRRVFVGTLDPNPRVAGGGIERLRAAGVEVHPGLHEPACRRLIAPFAKHVTTGLPWVLLKAAATLDGRTATAGGDSKWISSPESRLLVHRLRDRLDAVMVGIGTVLRDDPLLTTRLPEEGRDPVRVVVDTDLRLPEEATLLRSGSPAGTIVATGPSAPAEKAARLERRGVRILRCAAPEGGVDLPELMRRLGTEGIQSILLEGGATLNGAALRAGIVDRVMFFLAPMLLGGGDAPGIFSGPGPQRLAGALRLQGVEVSRSGDDILVEGEVAGCSPA